MCHLVGPSNPPISCCPTQCLFFSHCPLLGRWMESYSVIYSSSQRGRLLSGFQLLRSESRMCDVTLDTGGQSFPCHRALLASSSDYFWALFGESTAERLARSVSLPALTAEGLEVILDFLYSGWLRLSSATLPDVLEAARYLQVKAAVSICEHFIIDGLTTSNCCRYANLADCHALQDALDTANHTIAMEMRTLLSENRQMLLELNSQSLMAVLEADEIPGVKEAELIKMALDWLIANGPHSLLKSNLILSRLRFGLVSSSDLQSLSHTHRAMATPLIRSQVTRALEYHRLGSAQPISQSRQSSLRASSNRVLLVGGGASPDWPGQQLLTFDPRNKKFSTLTTSLPRRLKNQCACSVGGFLFVIGGEEVKAGDEEEGKSFTISTSNQVWRFDPRFGFWEEVEPMLEKRALFSCSVEQDVIYAIGGRHTTKGTHTSVASVEFYDMAAGQWRRGVTLPRPLYGQASAVLEKGIYVSGGIPGNQATREAYEASREVLFWDVTSKVWEKRAPMLIARVGHRMATISGRVYALLGMYEPYCDIERYDCQADQWTRLRPLLIGSFSYGMAVSPSGVMLLFGGRKWTGGQEVTVKSVLEYDAQTDRWRKICQLPRPLAGVECTLLPLPD